MQKEIGGMLGLCESHVAYVAAKKPLDFVIGTGKMHSVKDFAKLAFLQLD